MKANIKATLVKDDLGGVCCEVCKGYIKPYTKSLKYPLITSEESIANWLCRVAYAACSVCDLVYKDVSEESLLILRKKLIKQFN
jgi:hypothetical protein